ncbi:MAG: M28 family peptidase [Deltaproteobacteria bacterium]|nr:M28 family peptidase [Deltaproteobacteria bacterium]
MLALLLLPGLAVARKRPALVGSPLVDDFQRIANWSDGRNPEKQRSFFRLTRWVAERFREQGWQPAGDRPSSFFAPFAYRAPRASLRVQQAFGDKRVETRNVIAVAKGDGSTNESLLVVAHIDGLSERQKKGLDGRRYYGANDNASGVAALLAISETLARYQRRFVKDRRRGNGLKRDVVFLVTSAEEIGLVGAEAFLRQSRQFSDTRFVAGINLDMIGRGEGLQIALHGGVDAVTSQANLAWRHGMAIVPKGDMARAVAGHQKDYPGFAGTRLYTAGDHWSLAGAGIPMVFYLGEVLDLHSAHDTPSRVELGLVGGTARHALRLLTRLAMAADLGQGVTLPTAPSEQRYPGYRDIYGGARRLIEAESGK